MTYTEALDFLYGLRLFGTKLGLEQTVQLAELAGNPHRQLRFIHVAGTNGKGSTCAMLESIYRAAGQRVGLFTSPHLVSFRERIQVDRQMISGPEVAALADRARGWLAQFPASAHPTFFEVITLMALCYFMTRRCDLIVWETGLGGRLDATNIVTPLASVITNIQLDHEKWLGSTIAQIASEKAGIIKPAVPVVTAAQHPEALAVIRSTASANGSRLICLGAEDVARSPAGQINLPLMGEHQHWNAALAVATVQLLQDQIPVSPGALRAGLQTVSWPGRFQLCQTGDGRTILLDGAHNPAGAEALRVALQAYYPDRRPSLILGIFRDKDWPGMCQILAPLAGRIFLVPLQSERTASPTDLERVCSVIAAGVETIACRSLGEALERAKADPFMVVTGSLHLVGEAMELLQVLPDGRGERDLNHWEADPSWAAKPVTTP